MVSDEARRYAVQVLRAAAQEQRNEADQVDLISDTDGGPHADGHRCAAAFLDRRADLIERQAPVTEHGSVEP